MVTLANFDGRSLALDLDAAFSPALKQKYVERKADEREQKDIELLRTAQGLAPQTASAPDKKSQGFLRRIAPGLADQLDSLNKDRNPDQVDELRSEAAINIETARRIRNAKSPAEKQRIILERASEFQKQGRDNRQLLKMSGMTPAEIDLQAQKAEMMGDATLKTLPPPTDEERMAARAQLAVRNPQAYNALMRDEAVQRQEEAQRAAQARAGAAQAQKEAEAAQQAQIIAQMRAGASGQPTVAQSGQPSQQTQEQFDAVGGVPLSFGDDVAPGVNAAGDPGLSFGEVAPIEAAAVETAQEAPPVDLVAQADAAYRQAQSATERAIAQRDSIADPKMRALADTVVKEFEAAEKDALADRDTEIEFAEATAQEDKFDAVTDMGKMIQDQQAIIDQFGEDSPQAKAFVEAMNAPEQPKLSDVSGMRTEFTKMSTDFVKMSDAVKKVNATKPDGPGDIALIFNYMKILDPGSTVREGEFATAEQAGGVSSRIVNQYNKLVNGSLLTDEMRKSFRNGANTLFETAVKTQIDAENQFSALAKRMNMNPQNVVFDFIDPDVRSRVMAGPKDPTENAIPDGTRARNSAGRVIEMRGGEWVIVK